MKKLIFCFLATALCAGAQSDRSRFHVRPAALAQSVTVAAAGTNQIDLSSADIAATVSSREVDDFPANGRMASQLYLPMPGAGISAAGNFDAVRVAGCSNEQEFRLKRSSSLSIFSKELTK